MCYFPNIYAFLNSAFLKKSISKYYGRFEPKLGEIYKDIHEAYDKIDARLRAEQFKVGVTARWAYQ